MVFLVFSISHNYYICRQFFFTTIMSYRKLLCVKYLLLFLQEFGYLWSWRCTTCSQDTKANHVLRWQQALHCTKRKPCTLMVTSITSQQNIVNHVLWWWQGQEWTCVFWSTRLSDKGRKTNLICKCEIPESKLYSYFSLKIVPEMCINYYLFMSSGIIGLTWYYK